MAIWRALLARAGGSAKHDSALGYEKGLMGLLIQG